MSLFKRMLSLGLAAVMALALAGCGGGSSPAPASSAPASGTPAPAPANAVELKLSHPNADGSAYDLGAKMFKELVEERTEGRYVINIFPNNGLGTQEEVTEAAQLGTIDLVVTSDDKLVNLVPEFGALGLPFFFDDTDDVNENMNGEIGDYLSEKLEPKGIKIISWLENGFRNVTNNRGPVVVPADVAGLKIRVSSAKTNMALFEAAGAVVTNVSFSELYSALQLGTCEAQENPFANIIDKKFYEVQKYLSLTNHVHTTEPMIISMATWNKLSPEDREIFAQAGREVSQWAYAYAKETEDSMLETLRDVIEVNEVDVDAWRALSEEVYKQFEGQYDQILALKK
jgi:tripartite ATP-independent transporter DctP family solute receptor